MPAAEQDEPVRPAAPRPSPPRAAQEQAPRTLPAVAHDQLAAYQGKVVLLDFWASWSQACVDELPRLQRLYRELADEGFIVIGVAVDSQDPDRVARVADEQGVTYPVILADPDRLAGYGGVRALPTRRLVDRQGVVREDFPGMYPVEEIREGILALLAE